MALLKIDHHISGVSSHCRQLSNSWTVESVEMENRVSGADAGDDPDDLEIADVRCELGMVEDQLCNIPYELYDLPDLKEILSVDTWNSSLTEEERFSLCAYLPDMDHQTFWLTVTELLGGNDMFFGNPLDEFFKRLKGGFYPPKVISFREGLQFLQRRKYYHSLRSYHENMAQMFIDMRRVWDQCERSTGVEERVYIWKTRKNSNGADLLDLNTYPEDRYPFSKEVNLKAIMYHSSKKTKFVENERGDSTLPPPARGGMKFISPSSGGKGFLKVNPSGNILFQKQNPESLVRDTLEHCLSAPKGVLKIVPKVSSIGLDQSKLKPMQLRSTLLVNTPGLKDSVFTYLPSSECSESPLQKKVDCREAHQQLHSISNQQEDELLHSAARLSRQSEPYMRKIKWKKNSSFPGIAGLAEQKLFGINTGTWKGNGSCHKGEHESLVDSMNAGSYACGGENLWQTLGSEDKEPYARFSKPYSFNVQYPEGDQCMEPWQKVHMAMNPRTPGVFSRISGIGTEEWEPSTAAADQVKSQHGISLGDHDLVLPITYKRRKAPAKLHSLDSAKTLAAQADLDSLSLKE